jgi:hypothetical protein
MNIVDKKFYNLFWKNSTCQEIFATHKSQLLENEVELILTTKTFSARRLVLTNSQYRKTGLKVSKRTDNESIELIHNIKNSLNKYFDATQIEAFFNERFGRTISKVKEDLNKRGWLKLLLKIGSAIDEEKDFFKLLSDYHLIPESIERGEEFAKYCEDQFKSHLQDLLSKENLSDLAISIDLLSTYYNNKIKNNLYGATKHYTDVLYDSENYKDRLELFDDLYEMEIIKGGQLKGYYECVECPPNTFSGVITSNIKPTKLKMKCPSCSKELSYMVPYELDEQIYKNIVHPDGLLFFAIQYLLELNKIPFQINQVYLKDVELDICLFDSNNQIYEVIELKMFKTDRPEDTQISNIKTSVSKIKNAINKLLEIDTGYKTIAYSLITNITNNNVLEEAKRELESDLKTYNISIYKPVDFYQKIYNKR